MEAPLIGHPPRLEPLKNFLDVVAKGREAILVTGPTGSGKKRIIQFLLENGSLNQSPVFSIPAFGFSEELWAKGQQILNSKGTLIVEGLEYLPKALQARFKDWLDGRGGVFPESSALVPEWRVVATSLDPGAVWGELRYGFSYHIQLPALNEVVEDIPYHIKYFLNEKSVRYLRYFFLLKTFFHQWGGNILELEHYLTQAMAYYNSLALKGNREVFGEKELRYYDDVLRGEWGYYPYRFTPGFPERLKEILTKTDFRSKIIKDGLVLSLLKEEPGFLVLDLTAPDFEEKAIQVYQAFLYYLNAKSE
jgi:DNA-binding NtrC family response regulator